MVETEDPVNVVSPAQEVDSVSQVHKVLSVPLVCVILLSATLNSPRYIKVKFSFS